MNKIKLGSYIATVELGLARPESFGMQRDPLIVGNIVGDVVDYFDASARLRVFYSNREMIIGSELRPSHVANQPMVEISGLSGSLYTFVSSLIHAACSLI
jgi:hypothetical protein